MNSTHQLKEKLKQELIKSGYPLEFFCLRNLGSWLLLYDKQYITPEGEHREVDFKAFIHDPFKNNDLKGRLQTFILSECKKNDSNPWVFFKEKSPFELNLSTTKERLTQRLHLLLLSKLNGHHYYTAKNRARSYSLGFLKGDKENRQIYESVSKLIDCFKFHLKRKIEWMKKSRDLKSSVDVDIYYLTVVFDGKLFVADLLKKDINLSEVNHLLLFVTHSEYGKYNHYTIDIVRKDYFPKYLISLKKDHSIIKGSLSKLSLN
jgi:hypothetical protein